MDKYIAEKFSKDWIAAWNSHDINRVLSHYTDDFEMTSPVIRKLTNEPTGMLKGKDTLRDHWSRALASNPGLHFKLQNTFIGADSIVVQYHGHRGLSAEVFYFSDDGKVNRAYAHYEQDISD